MTFPVSASGSFRVHKFGAPDECVRVLEDDMCAWLSGNRINRIRILPVGISFEVDLAEMFWSYRNPLALIDKGFIAVSPTENSIAVRYELVCQRVMLLVTMLIIFGFGSFLIWFAKYELVYVVPMLLVLWFWLVGGSYVFWRSRIGDELRNIAEIRAMVGVDKDQTARSLT